MLQTPVDFLRKVNLSNTVLDMAKHPTVVTGFNFWGYEIDNTQGSALVYIQFFNLPAASVTLGTTVADLVIAVSAGSARGFGFGPYLIFEKGLSAAATTTKSGSTAPAVAVDVTTYFEEK